MPAAATWVGPAATWVGAAATWSERPALEAELLDSAINLQSMDLVARAIPAPRRTRVGRKTLHAYRTLQEELPAGMPDLVAIAGEEIEKIEKKAPPAT